ncbi:MAG: hypothetical protein QG608_1834 [Actinomycetota bacterium]|nr:hypothetical protein [Actinomycetota bacterium]
MRGPGKKTPGLRRRDRRSSERPERVAGTGSFAAGTAGTAGAAGRRKGGRNDPGRRDTGRARPPSGEGRRASARDPVVAPGNEPAGQRLRTVVLILLALGLAWAGTSLLERPPTVASLRAIPWWLPTGLFVVAGIAQIRLHPRRATPALDLVGVPLVMGLFLMDPGGLVLSRGVASLSVALVYHRLRPLRALREASTAALATAVACGVFGLLIGQGTTGTRAAGVAVLAALVGAVTRFAALLLTVEGSLELDPGPHRTWWDRAGQLGLVAVSGALGYLLVRTSVGGDAAVPLGVAGGIAALAYRAFIELSDRHVRLQRLYELSDALAEASSLSDVAGQLVLRSRQLLGARFSEVMLTGLDGTARTVWSWSEENGLTGPQDLAWAVLPPGVLPTGPSAVLRPTSHETRAVLRARRLDAAVVVPLKVDGTVAGHLLVGRRESQDGRFASGQARLLEAIANHGSVALRNGRLIDQLHFEARHDALTGLPNRASFHALLHEAARQATAGGPACAVMMLDLDGFKAINDTLGHQTGDDLLKEISRRLFRTAGQDATVARLGGDEFAVVSTRCGDHRRAVELGRRLLGSLDVPVVLGENRLRVGGSLGISLGPVQGRLGVDLMRNADIAMYAAKRGAGGLRLFSEDLVENSTESLTLAGDLRDALEGHEITAMVQPIVNLQTASVHSVEVFPHWEHPGAGEIPLETVFDTAARSGQVPALTMRILDMALSLCGEWRRGGTPLRVAVNLTDRCLSDPAAPRWVTEALERHEVPPELLCLEISENGVNTDSKQVDLNLEQFRQMGVHLSVDDFGTGFSSLVHVSRLPVNQLKIDRQFVRRLHGNARERAVVRSILDLGHNLELEVVAKDVPDNSTRELLVSMGCRLAQGEIFARAMDPQRLASLLGLADAPEIDPGARPDQGPARVALRRFSA